jgi:integrase
MLRKLALLDETLTDLDLPEMAELGEVANHFASESAFADFRARRSENTLRRHDADLDTFATFLTSCGMDVGELAEDPHAWEGITWGLVAAFQKWMLSQGYAVSTTNIKIGTVKSYAKLAFRAGVLDETQYALISGVEGYSRKEGKRIDEKRQDAGIPVRYDLVKGKKSESVSLNNPQANQLKNQPDTPQGRRDSLLMCLLLDHGLRVSEVAILEVENFNLVNGELSFYRPKVDHSTTHETTHDTLLAALAYITQDTNPEGALLRGSVKGGNLVGEMSSRAISKRVSFLGRKIGIANLSPHDCRHYAATYYAKTKKITWLMDFFGWTSPAMAVRYIESAKVISTK